MNRLLLAMGLTLATSSTYAAPIEKLELKGAVEGLSLADVDGDGRSEIAALIRNGSATNPNHSNGSVALFDATGALRWERLGEKYLSGAVTSADFDGDGKNEISYCELDEAGRCFVVDEDGATLWQTPELFYPAITGVAPAAADLSQDGVADLVTVSWGGTVSLYDGPTGSPIWSYEAYSELGELFHCNPTLFDLDEDGVEDVILLGARRGQVVALNGKDGTLLWVSDALKETNGHYSRGNGLLVTELEDGPGRQLLIAMRGESKDDPSALYGFSRDGQQLFRTEIPGVLSYMAPVAGDIDGDGSREIFVQSRSGALYQIDGAGHVVRTVSVGEESWLTPSFVDADGDGVVELIASSTTGVHLLSGNELSVVTSFEDLGVGLQPPPVVADLERDGRVEFFLGSWNGTELFRVQLESPSWSRWDTLGGDGRHQGQHSLGTAGGTLVVQLSTLRSRVKERGESLGGWSQRTILAASNQLSLALYESTAGNPHAALSRLRKADALLLSSGHPGPEREEIFHLSLLLARQLVDRTRANLSSQHRNVERADQLLADAVNQAELGLLSVGLISIQQAVSKVDKTFEVEGNHCASMALREPYLVLQCELLTALDRLPAAETSARADLEDGLSTFPRLEIAASLAKLARSVATLDAPDLALELAHLARRLTRVYLDDRRFAEASEDGQSAAEQSYQSGLDALEIGAADVAGFHFEEAAAHVTR